MEFKIPPLPGTLGEVLQLMSGDTPTTGVERLVSVIRRDPATSVYVLRHVNSPENGLRRYIAHIEQAVVLLGFERVCNLVLTATLKQTFDYLESAAAYNIYEYVMRTSLATATFARDLSIYLQTPFAETAFTAGLLHQVGRLVLLQSASQVYTTLWYQRVPNTKQLTFGPPAPEREGEVFNTTYPHLGAAVMKQWAFPPELVSVTGALLDPTQLKDSPTRLMALTVAAASAVSTTLFDDKPPASKQADDIPTPIRILSHVSCLDAEILTEFFAARHETVRAFAEGIL